MIEKQITGMKKTFHLCLSADHEVMFRDTEDYNRGFNYFALALYKTDSTGLVESFMSNHVHFLVQSANPDKFMGLFRMPYAKYFNNKYSRTGSLGEPHHFCTEVRGLYHHLAAMSYILRNALHHGVVPIPYAYPHSSVNAIFRKEMGKHTEEELLPSSAFYRHIGRRAHYPDTYKMTKSGLFLRESVLDIAQVENMYMTPRTFDYYMSRKTSEDWINEQNKDNNASSPISLESIEAHVRMTSVKQMLAHESGRSDYRKISDIELCDVIDRIIQTDFGKSSVYHLSQSEKQNLACRLAQSHYPSNEQLKRCLVL